MISVTCMETGKQYIMDAKTPIEALQKMKYTLDLSRQDKGAVINKTNSGLHLWMEHTGKTYSVRNG